MLFSESGWKVISACGTGGVSKEAGGCGGATGGGEGEARGQVGHCAVQKDSGNLGTVAEDKNFIGGGFPLRN